MASTNDNDDDVWGDDDDELYLLATQMEQNRELQQETMRISSRNLDNRIRNVSNGTGSTVTVCPTQAELAFNMRRQDLEQRSATNTQSLSCESTLSASVQAHIAQILKVEKEKQDKLQSSLYRANGEASIVRKTLEDLKKAQQEDLIKAMKKNSEEKAKHAEEKQKLTKEINSLKTENRRANDEIANLRSKSAMNQSKLNLSVGGATPSPHQRANTNQSTRSTPSPINRAQVAPPKPRSDPNMSTHFQRNTVQSPVPTALTTQPRLSSTQLIQPNQTKSPSGPDSTCSSSTTAIATVSASVQADAKQIRTEQDDELVFGADRNKIDVSQLESLKEACGIKVISIRENIATKLSSLIQISYMGVKPELENAVRMIPNEIMMNHAPGLKFRAVFVNEVDCIFSRGTDENRKRDCEERQEEYREVQYPKLPCVGKECAVDLSEVQERIKEHYIQMGAWAGLREIKLNLKRLLEDVSGELRYGLFQQKTVTVLWHLLEWTKHLWGLIAFEEEVEELVNDVGKEVWINELTEWGGLILKIDWRDFFDPALETIIRKLSLSILTSIVVTGYFETSQKRYEILHSVLKDTLLKEHLQTPSLIKKCLIILTWSVADKNILNYLCLNRNDSECLARVLANAVLKCFKENYNQYESTIMLVLYMNLLENLMVKKPRYHYASKVSRPKHEQKNTCLEDVIKSIDLNLFDSDDDDTDHEKDDDGNVEDEEEEMDVDGEGDSFHFQATQFASDKYAEAFQEGCEERARKFNRIKEVGCWLNPKQWERKDADDGGKKYCQCRRYLLGNVFIMIYEVTKFWEEAFEKHGKQVELNEKRDEIQLQKNSEMKLDDDARRAQLRKKVESLRDFITEFCNTPGKTKIKEHVKIEDDSDFVQEWTWDDLLKYLRNSSHFTKDPIWAEDKERRENIYDYVMRRGALFMCFAHIHSDNLALALRSEAYTHYALLEPIFTFYNDSAHFTLVERRNVLEGYSAETDEAEKDSSDDSTSVIFYADGEEEIKADDILDLANFYEKNKDSLLDDFAPHGETGSSGSEETEEDVQKMFELMEEERARYGV